MLLENPRLRFTESKLETLRMMARGMRRDKEGKFYTAFSRDDGYNRHNTLERRRNRKDAAKRVAEVLAMRRDDIATVGLLTTAMVGYYGGSHDSLERMLCAKYDFNVHKAVHNNHKSEWIAPVWFNERWFQNSPYCFYHDVHQSEDDPTQIAYNRSIDNIRRNIQTRTRPGKYLTQFFSDVLSPAEIKEWAEKQVAAATCVAELKFIENDNPDGWVDVYERGPSSCMRGKDAVKVYALEGNGLRLAYLQTGEDIVSRCIVVDATNDDEIKGWVRIYASEQRWYTTMRQMIEAAGYTEQTNLNGVKIKLIDTYEGYVCPYIDYGNGGEQTVSLNHSDGTMIIGGGDYDATNTDGFVNIGSTCDCCGESGFSDGDMTYIDSENETVCPSCRDSYYTYAYGRRYEDWYPVGDCIYCESNGNYYHQDYYGDHGIVYLEDRDAYFHIEDCVEVTVGDNEGQWVHCDDYDTDHVSGEVAHEGEFQQINGHSVHESYVVSCYVSGDDVDMRECVEIKLHTKHTYPYSSFYTKPEYVYIHQDNLTADVILSDFVQCGTLLLPNTYYGNPVSCCTHTNLIYGEEYDGDRIEDVLVADAEERVANAEVREIFSMAA